MTPELQDDELLRSYLLGKLPDEDADTLERRLLAEDDLFDLAEAVEMDLLAAADRGTFTPEEKEEILRKLAATPRGRERLAFARSLNNLADEPARKQAILPYRPARSFPPPSIRWMAMAASLVMVTGLGWFAWQHRAQAPDTTKRITVLTPAPAPRPLPPSPTPATSPPTKTSKSSPNRPAIQKVPTAVMTLSFLNLRGDEGRKQLKVAPDIHRVEIQIYADGLGDAKSFGVVVRSKDQGTSIMEKKGLKPRALPSGSGLVLHIPAKQLPAGRYEIAVTPQGGDETVQDFEVVEGER